MTTFGLAFFCLIVLAMLWLDAACEMRGVSLVTLLAAVAADGFCLCDEDFALLSEASSN